MCRAPLAHRGGRGPLRERGTASTWRQWAFVKDGWAFMVVSVLHADNEDQLLPDVKRMLASFEVVSGAAQ